MNAGHIDSPRLSSTMDTDQNAFSDLTDLQRALFYTFFVNQCPSLKNYVVTLGLHLRYRTHAELQDFCKRLDQHRSGFKSYATAMALAAEEWQCLN